jgi:hypothetical protein
LSSKLADPSPAAGVAVGAGADSAGGSATGVAVGVAAAGGVSATGVEAGVGAGGVETGVAAGVGVPAGLEASAGGDGLQEERNATAAAEASTRKDALFIRQEAFLRTRRNSTPVEICILQFTGSDTRANLTVQSAHVAELADACASGAHGETLGGSNPLVSTARILRIADPLWQASDLTNRHRNDPSTTESQFCPRNVCRHRGAL